MESLVRELIPHAPDYGLFLAPDIPEAKLDRALKEFGGEIAAGEVIALYDATRLGTGGDGAVFTSTRFAWQNNNLQSPQQARYADVVGVRSRRRLLGGRYLEIEVNRGRSTVPMRMDFSARPEATAYVERLVREAMLVEPAQDSTAAAHRGPVRQALDALVAEGHLTEQQMKRMLDVLG